MYQVYSFQYTRYIHFPIPHDKHLTTGHYEVTYFHWAPLTCVVRTQHSSMRPLRGEGRWVAVMYTRINQLGDASVWPPNKPC